MILFHSFLIVFAIASVCACRNLSRLEEARVVGGHDAPDHKYKYIVSLQDQENKHFCAGSIIDEEWILTAAHCVESRDPANYFISVGSNYLDSPGKIYKPEFHLVHEKYQNFHNRDIALVRVSSKITFDADVQPISISREPLLNSDFLASFAGWGSTKLDGSVSNTLQEIDLKILSNDECKIQVPKIDETHVCTYNKIFEGVCHADSGGPLVLDNYLIGIASYVTPCALGIPDVFTRVYSYSEWITNKIQNFS